MKGHRIAKTNDGRYVPDTHADAAYLAYSQHDDVPENIVKKAFPDSVKSEEKPSDKSSVASEDKGRGTNNARSGQTTSQHHNK